MNKLSATLSALLALQSAFCSVARAEQQVEPVRLGVVGLVHDHVHGLLGRQDRGDIEIVGIVEPNQELARRYAKQHGFSMDLVFPSITEMLDTSRPEAVAAFNSIHGHLEVVQACAPRGIHVMVEKPLAVSMAHAQEMEKLARTHKILLLTNYETTWYGSNARMQELVQKESLGPLRKIVVHDGHLGPSEIGVTEEFLEWLTDPELNGGGAITDFGCYGANLITWLMDNEKPTAVTAVTQQIKPEVYPRVDDEATIVPHYPQAQGIIQASWNWPFSRKDMEVYGKTGYAICVDQQRMRLRFEGQSQEQTLAAPAPESPRDDPFAYLSAAVRGSIEVTPADLSSLENNMIVVAILEAAKTSAQTGETVELP